MSTIAAAVFDAIQSEQGRACTPQDVCRMVEYDNAVVISALHRLKDLGILQSHRDSAGIAYTIARGAQRPSDGRGRPRKKLK